MIGSLFSYLRNLAVHCSQAFTCCAGCEALPMPVGNRLCVSIAPQWVADAVLPSGWAVAELPAAVNALRRTLPWLRRVHVPAYAVNASGLFLVLSENAAATAPAKAKPCAQGVFPLPAGITEAELYLVETLAEHFLVLPPGRLPATPLLAVDFFTPNGLPLLFAAPGGSAEEPKLLPGLAGRTKSLSSLFAEACAVDPLRAAQCDAEGYTLAFARWAYAERHGILAPAPFPT